MCEAQVKSVSRMSRCCLLKKSGRGLPHSKTLARSIFASRGVHGQPI
jgi:hypothetical protein